jgi:hypothetical protein
MWCSSCPGTGDHTEYCPERLFEELGVPVQEDRLSLPWSPSPHSWLFGGLDEFPDLTSSLDLSLFDVDELPDELLDLVSDGRVATETPMPQCNGYATAAGSADQVCTDKNLDGVADNVVTEPDLFAYETSLEDPEGGFPVAIPGWNVSNYEEVDNNVPPSAWPTALEIAEELIREASVLSPRVSGAGCDSTSPARDEALQNVNGPDAPSASTLASSGIIPEAAPTEARYVPEVSSVSEYGVTDLSSSDSDRVLGPSPIQQHWTRAQARSRRMAPSRIAMVRPRPRQASLLRRRRNIPQMWHISTTSPIIQTHSILSRVTDSSGDTLREDMNSQYHMTRTVATQMLTPLYADVQTGMSDQDRPRNVIVIRVGGVLGAMRRNEAAAAIPRTDAPQLGREGTTRPTSVPAPIAPSSPSAEGEGDSTESSSAGTPLLDE